MMDIENIVKKEDTELENKDEESENKDEESENKEVEILEDLETAPAFYKSNSPKEIKVILCAENLLRQFRYLYPNRRHPFLFRPNECGVQKVVCTSVRPTVLPYPEMNNWHGCADFVADYLTYKTLDPPTALPKCLESPDYTLRHEEGNSLNFSVVLCSFLLGAGYDAYVVLGYGDRELCLMDERLKPCPLLIKAKQEEAEKAAKVKRKYSVKPPRDLSSNFEHVQKGRRLREQIEEEERQRQEEERRIAEIEKPPPDPLHGGRIHFWVLVLAGARDIEENFFIEASTGEKRAVDNSQYIGIESLWNHSNFWINMQEAKLASKDFTFDFHEPFKWEYFLPVDKDGFSLADPDSRDEKSTTISYVSDMPVSWVELLQVSPVDFERRYPGGTKLRSYKCVQVEKFSPYLRPDGIVTKISIYEDKNYQNLKHVKEYFFMRMDLLQLKDIDHDIDEAVEYFTEGRPDALIEHSYKMHETGLTAHRVMKFNSKVRADGLVIVNTEPTEMKADFVERRDNLSRRCVTYAIEEKPVAPAEDQEPPRRPILKIEEKYDRDKSLPADENVETRTFGLAEEFIRLQFHIDENRISASYLEFSKPPESEDKGQEFEFAPGMWTCFQADFESQPYKKLHLYQTLVKLMEEEKEVIEKVRQAEDELTGILNQRSQEEANPVLLISSHDTRRNKKVLKRREEEARQAEKEKKEKDDSDDYLAPYFAQLGFPETLNEQQAENVYKDCLNDCIQRIVAIANTLQDQLDNEKKKLKERHEWYESNYGQISKKEKQEYQDYTKSAALRISVLELRLNRHQESAPEKYKVLERKLKLDPRLDKYTHTAPDDSDDHESEPSESPKD